MSEEERAQTIARYSTTLGRQAAQLRALETEQRETLNQLAHWIHEQVTGEDDLDGELALYHHLYWHLQEVTVSWLCEAFGYPLNLRPEPLPVKMEQCCPSCGIPIWASSRHRYNELSSRPSKTRDCRECWILTARHAVSTDQPDLRNRPRARDKPPIAVWRAWDALQKDWAFIVGERVATVLTPRRLGAGTS